MAGVGREGPRRALEPRGSGLDAGECRDPVLASRGLSSKPGRGGKGGVPTWVN